jgi:crotonobetainyl-CoA:carnitine CoA-transferase CaiB-like acyl-CoA transferase
VTDEAAWAGLCAEAGRGWERDPRFGDAALRVAFRAELDGAVADWTAGRDKRELAAALQRRGVAAAPVLRAPEWMDDPALVEAGFFSTLPNADLPVLHADGLPPVIDRTRDYHGWQPAPAPGADGPDVLHGLLGLDPATVDALVRRGIVSVPPPPTEPDAGDRTHTEERREVPT